MRLPGRIVQAMVAASVVTGFGALTTAGTSAAPQLGRAEPTAYRYLTLSGVDALAGDDVWVSGGGDGGSAAVRHWDGHSWKGMPPHEQGVLNDIAEGAPDDVWAVGSQYTNNATVGVIVPLRDVTSISRDDAWIVGYWDTRSPDGADRILMHWDGRTWTLRHSPR